MSLLRYFKRKRDDEDVDSHTPEILIFSQRSSLSVYHDFSLCPELDRQIRALPIVDKMMPSGPCLLHQPKVVVYGQCCRQRRDVGFFSDESIGYQYSGNLMPAQPLPKWMADIMRRVNELLRTSFNGILVNHYPDGESTIGAHSDDERALDKRNLCVAAISFGATRKFRVRNKSTRTLVKDVPTLPYSLMVMQGDFQSEYTHEIPVEKRVTEPRWSMTFRSHVK